jgi:hypothetical protein
VLAEGVAVGETDGGFVGGVVEDGKGWRGGVGEGADEAAGGLGGWVLGAYLWGFGSCEEDRVW